MKLNFGFGIFFRRIFNAFSRSGKGKKYYPFSKARNEYEPYAIVVPLEDEEYYPKYYEFFAKNGYEGHGFCWEGHIIQILETVDDELLSHIDFDPEPGCFYAHADSKNSQVRFMEILAPIFSNLNKLEEWVKKADRERIDD